MEIFDIPQDKYNKYKSFIDKQIITDPPDELREIYEQRVLSELTNIRAEKYDSPENKKELLELQKNTKTKEIPRNIQNPNYDYIMKNYKLTRKKHTPFGIVSICNNIHDYIMKLDLPNKFDNKFNYKPKLFNYLVDVRCCEDLPMFFNYLFTFKFYELVEKFNNLLKYDNNDLINIVKKLLMIKLKNNKGEYITKDEYIDYVKKNIPNIYTEKTKTLTENIYEELICI